MEGRISIVSSSMGSMVILAAKVSSFILASIEPHGPWAQKMHFDLRSPARACGIERHFLLLLAYCGTAGVTSEIVGGPESLEASIDPDESCSNTCHLAHVFPQPNKDAAFDRIYRLDEVLAICAISAHQLRHTGC